MAPATVVALVLAASTASEVKLAAPQWSGANVTPESARFWTGHLAQQLTLLGPRVITGEEIAALLGVERQKQLLGCAELEGSCMAELANALGSDAVIIGSVGHFGDQFQINIKIVASGDGKQLALFSSSVTGEAAVVPELTRAAQELAQQLLTALGVKSVGKAVSRRWWALAPAVLGVAALGVGAGTMVAANDDASQLRDPNTTLQYADAVKLYGSGRDNQRIGIGSLIGGGVLLAGAVALFFVLAEPAESVALTPGGHSLGVALEGVRW